MDSDQPSYRSPSSTICYTSGRFKGHTLRGELAEIQSASIGRKSSGKDRRPIDPPPIAKLRLFEVAAVGKSSESDRELDYSDMAEGGFVCHCDLYRLSNDAEADVPHNIQIAIAPASGIASSEPQEPSPNRSQQAAAAVLELSEASCCDSDIVGAKTTNSAPINVLVNPGILFPFMDVNILSPGVFALRYRVFDLLSRDANDGIPALAECFGAPFRVYSTHRFPGLPVATRMTQLVSMAGVKTARRSGNRRQRKSAKRDESQEGLGGSI